MSAPTWWAGLQTESHWIPHGFETRKERDAWVEEHPVSGWPIKEDERYPMTAKNVPEIERKRAIMHRTTTTWYLIGGEKPFPDEEAAEFVETPSVKWDDREVVRYPKVIFEVEVGDDPSDVRPVKVAEVSPRENWDSWWYEIEEWRVIGVDDYADFESVLKLAGDVPVKEEKA